MLLRTLWRILIAVLLMATPVAESAMTPAMAVAASGCEPACKAVAPTTCLTCCALPAEIAHPRLQRLALPLTYVTSLDLLIGVEPAVGSPPPRHILG